MMVIKEHQGWRGWSLHRGGCGFGRRWEGTSEYSITCTCTSLFPYTQRRGSMEVTSHHTHTTLTTTHLYWWRGCGHMMCSWKETKSINKATPSQSHTHSDITHPPACPAPSQAPTSHSGPRPPMHLPVCSKMPPHQ